MFYTSKVTKILIAASIAAGGMLDFLLHSLGVLPVEYMLMAVGLTAALPGCAVLLILTGWEGSVRRTVGTIILTVIMILFSASCFYVHATQDAIKKISGQNDKWETYDVIVLTDGSYKKAEDIKGRTVGICSVRSKQQDEAKERLVTGFGVEYEAEGDIFALGERLVDSSGNTHDDIIMIPESDRRSLMRKIDGFKENTKIIYEMRVTKRTDDRTSKVDVTKDSFNILISGKDQWGKIGNGEGLSDVNMIVTVNPRTKDILLTSIPRDSYLPMHSFGAKDKLTHTGTYGLSETRSTLEDFLGIDIDRSVNMNFSMLVRLVNAIGGIDVESDKAFKSSISKYSYKKGLNHMNGKQALFFVRERKAFKDGDMQRNVNQQKVMKAVIKKATESETVLAKYPKIMDAVSTNMTTDFSEKEIKKLVKLTFKDKDLRWSVNSMSVTGTTGTAPCYSMGNKELSCVFPSDESVEKVKIIIHDTMYPIAEEH